jgi:hypothetical protein
MEGLMPKIEKVMHVPVILHPSDTTPVERIEVIPDFLTFKIGALEVPDLIDQYAGAKLYEPVLKKWLGAANDVLKLKCPIPEGEEQHSYDGRRFQINHAKRSRQTLSVEKCIAKFGEEALKDCYQDTPYTEIRYKPLPIL